RRSGEPAHRMGIGVHVQDHQVATLDAQAAGDSHDLVGDDLQLLLAHRTGGVAHHGQAHLGGAAAAVPPLRPARADAHVVTTAVAAGVIGTLLARATAHHPAHHRAYDALPRRGGGGEDLVGLLHQHAGHGDPST